MEVILEPIVLWRPPGELEYEQERDAIIENFLITNSRMTIQPKDLVICRYSCLPFYKELEYDIIYKNAELINSYVQHNYVADIFNWYWDFEGLTPKTWFRPSDVPNQPGSFVLKGQTNSKKFLWDSHMFAPDYKSIMDIYCRLQDDALIGQQGIYIREYVPLFNYTISIHGLPISKEFRFFVAYEQILSGGFYWSNFAEEIEKPSVDEVPKEFLDEIIKRIGNKINFYAVDVAQTQEGKWIVIELNDGQMSGLSENDPNELYRNLRRVVWQKS